MKLSNARIAGLFGLALGCQLPQAMAGTGCYWLGNPGPMTFTADLGSVYVPRDAATGSVIGHLDRFVKPGNAQGLAIICENDDIARLTFDAMASVPRVPNKWPGNNGINADSLLQTNIPGVGARIRLGFPFDGSANNAFTPVNGDPTVPFTAEHQRQMGVNLRFSEIEARVTLVKTGDIDPGPQPIRDQELFSGQLTGIAGKALGFALSGTVIQAHCGASSTVSADPVELGDWDQQDFSHKGYTTRAVPFSITLGACVADPDPSLPNIATAHIQLDPISGSTPLLPDIGVFSLASSASTAEGVGMQILQEDGSTPLRLGDDNRLIPITSGTTVLGLAARFYQTEDPDKIRPGSAKGALSFTITYQ
ncbi:fimbrial protein [Pseudomonas batumici]|uniref:fimbrial protein n=1 Tax=Pseudomonas batumici TaxID=226910 RepID=UPI0030CCC563